MNVPHPGNEPKIDVIAHLEEFRRRVIIVLSVFIGFSFIAFYWSPRLFGLVKQPVRGLVDDLVSLAPTEVLAAYIRISLLTAFVAAVPFFMWQAWAFISPALPGVTRKKVLLWAALSLFCLIAGVMFSYFFALPLALHFLIDITSRAAVPLISVGKYTSFFGAVILAGVILFQVPVILCLGTFAGLIDPLVLRKKRAMAFLGILVLSAVITPTQDIFNMLLFAIPMFIFYEVGILASTFIARNRSNREIS